MQESYNYFELSHLQKVQLAIRNTLTIDSSIRPLNANKRPGGLLEFPPDDNREVIIVGDLHANKANLKAILVDSQNLYKLKADEAIMIFLGDSVHDERMGHRHEMASSVEIMDIVIHLINDYPDNVFYLLGNHDTFSPRLGKSGIKQGLLHYQELKKQRGEEYVNVMQRFLNILPLAVLHKHFIAFHAGPARGGITRDQLINIRSSVSADLLRQITWNRLNETRSYPSKKEYSEDDLEKQRSILNYPPDTPIIVGHNPMWKWGTEDSIWENILETKNHTILYCNLENICPYISFSGSGKYKKKYANLRIAKSKFLFDDQGW